MILTALRSVGSLAASTFAKEFDLMLALYFYIMTTALLEQRSGRKWPRSRLSIGVRMIFPCSWTWCASWVGT